MKNMDLSTKLTVLGTVIAIIGLVPLAYFIYDRYVKGKIIVEYNEDNVIVAPIYGINKTYEGTLALGITAIKIKNLTNTTKTIESVKLKYEFDGKEYVIDSHVLPVGTDKLNKTGIIIKNIKGNPQIADLSWKNLRPEIYKYEPLSPEGILSGSVLFIFHTCKMNDFDRIKKIEFIITDSKNKNYKQKFEMKEKYSEYFKAGYIFVHESEK